MALTAFFYCRKKYEPKNLFGEIKPHIQLLGGTLSVDDTVDDITVTQQLINWNLVGQTSSQIVKG